MKYALISLSDKEGVIPFAEGLVKQSFKIISTGGTARYLADNGIKVTLIEEVTGFPEILDGRVKTLHPKVFGGILADRENNKHKDQLREFLINTIDMVVVNLYPFRKLYNEKLNDKTASISHVDMIENIDIGGVTLLRAAAKNYRYVSVVTDKEDYYPLLEELSQNGEIGYESRTYLAEKAFATTSAYDRYIYQYFQKIDESDRKELFLFPSWEKEELRYGENPHQKAVFYSPGKSGMIEQLHGKQLSYNNYLDINAALKLIYRFDEPTVAIFKHTNPCGVASAENLLTAYEKCLATDPLSPFGGIVVVNRPLDLPTIEAINKVFTEIIIAPEYSPEFLDLLSKKKDRRLIRYDVERLNLWAETETFVSCLDGVLSQKIDIKNDEEEEWQIVTEKKPSEREYESLRFCWRVVTALKSNAICLGRDGATIGLGMGQTSRIDSAEFAVYRAEKFGHVFQDAVCASDGFFPFRDGVDYLSGKGISAIIQPGGSKGDEDVIKACNEHGISMIFTGKRHFAH